MDSRVLAVMARKHGLATTRDLVAVGIEQRQVARWLKSGELHQVRWSVYTTRDLWKSWDIYHDRPLARIRAASSTLRVPFVFSHDSSAIPLRLPLIRPQDSAIHITRTELRGSRTSGGIHHHGALYDAGQVVDAAGLRVLDRARTVVDLARDHGYRAGLVAADGAMQHGVSRTELRAAAAAMAGWPYSLTVNAVVRDADPGAESVAESLGRELLMELGQEGIETQFPVAVPNGVAWCDLRVGRHLIEVDGHAKLIPVLEGGLAQRPPHQVLWDQHRRQLEVCAGRFGMSRLTWEDFWGSARERAKERVMAELVDTEHRYGSELTAEQAQFAARMRGRRYKAG